MSLIFHILIYVITLTIFIYASLLLKPRIWLHRIPPVVRTKVNGETLEEKRWFAVLGVLMGLVFFFYPIAITALMYSQLHHILLSLFTFTAGFAIWDTIILNLFIFCGVTPKPMIIEGTSKHDYKDKVYHLKSGIKGLLMPVVYSVVVGLIFQIIKP